MARRRSLEILSTRASLTMRAPLPPLELDFAANMMTSMTGGMELTKSRGNQDWR